MKITATILKVGQPEQFKSGSFKKTIRIETEEKYPQILEVEFWNDKTEQLNLFGQGDKVDIEFNLSGRLWESKDGKEMIFMSLTGWRIETHQAEPRKLPKDPMNLTSKQMGNIESNFVEDAIRDLEGDEDDGLPF